METVLEIPPTEPELEPILLNIPLQVLAYHVAVSLRREIDQPGVWPNPLLWREFGGRAGAKEHG